MSTEFALDETLSQADLEHQQPEVQKIFDELHERLTRPPRSQTAKSPVAYAFEDLAGRAMRCHEGPESERRMLLAAFKLGFTGGARVQQAVCNATHKK